MKTTKRTLDHRRRSVVPGLLLALPTFLVFALTAHAFQFGKDDFQASLDTTVSYGLSWRVQDQKGELIGTSNGGRAYSVNGDDGNLNYDTGLISNVFKMTSELELTYRNFGGFFRGTAFYDFENENSSRDRTQLTSNALDLVGSDVDLLDAYLWGSFNLGAMPVDIRVGEQVVNWGESTYIQNSINAINPVNVNALRLPGSELREALVPEGMVWVSVGVTENISFEGLYLYDWEETDIDPPGSYWSTNDFAGDGGNKVMLGWGDVPDMGLLPPSATFMAVPRGSTDQADNQGQFGLACRIFAPILNDTEFGLYFLRYHSRLPIISSTTGFLAPDLNSYLKTARYRTEYPEYINLYGISFNSMLGKTGIALQGEVSYRDDMPLQVDDIELLYATMGALPTYAALALFNQVGNYLGQFGTDISGYILRDVSQVQATATKFFGPTFGTDQIVLLGEVGLTHVHDMPSNSELRLEGPGTYVSGNPILGPASHPGKPIEDSSNFADATSWGYRLVCRLDFNNVFRAVNVMPRVAWQHDVNGNSPGPGGNFLEGRKAISFGVAATYLESWSVDMSYSNYTGAGRHNLINDRDFIQCNIKYSF
jgi:hypothetical protein